MPLLMGENLQAVDQKLMSQCLERGALLAKPNEWVLLASGAGSDSSFLMKDFFQEKKIIDQSFAKPIFLDWKSWCNYWSKKNSPLEVKWSEPSDFLFSKYYQSIQNKISSNEIVKAVPVIVKRGLSNVPLSFFELMTRLLNQGVDANTWIYGAWDKGSGFIGQAPEVLFFKNKYKIKTMALAGTSAKSKNENDFLNDPKEIFEHEIVVSSLQKKLSQWGSVERYPRQVLALKYLNHLQTHLELTANLDISVDELLQKLHPTPALGSEPLDLNFLQTIREDNTYLGAPFVVTRGDQTLALVSIRYLQFNGSQLSIPAGCGVVASSDLNREFNEVKNKMNSVQRSFDL